MERRHRPWMQYVLGWTAGGILLGIAFVVGGWFIGRELMGVASFSELHSTQPVMYIVDLGPFVIGSLAAIIGVLHHKVAVAHAKTRELAEDIATAWTADLQRANLELAGTLRQREQVYAVLSHELRTPLTAIVGFSQLADELDPAPAEAAQYVSEIYGSATFLLGLVNELLEAAKLQHHGIEIQVSNVDGDLIIAEVAQLLSPLASQRQVRLDVQTVAGSGCRADDVRFRQVMTNLVSNAIKYTEDGTVTIRTTVAGDTYAVEVSDEGPGLALTDLSRIFDAFEQASEGAGRRDSTGLGLAICRSFAEAMGGRITAQSEGLGKGATFRLELPVASNEAVMTRSARMSTALLPAS